MTFVNKFPKSFPFDNLMLLNYQMEIRRFELLTPCLQGRCSPN